MIWIIPKSLTSVSVPVTAALTWGSNECCEVLAQSLMRKSMSLPAASWRRVWKAGNLILPRFGLMLSRSHTATFTAKWTSCLPDILASRSVRPDFNSASLTLDTFGPQLPKESALFDLGSFSSKTCRVISPSDSTLSCETFKALVTAARLDYSQRLKSVRATNAGGYSSLPTPCANEDSFRLNGSSQQSKTLEARARRGELQTAGATIPAGPLNPAFVEVMMGLPIGWTDCASSETASSPQSPSELSVSS
jgi:hypothetical protein